MIGTGYVGLVTGTCLAESGNTVTCVDNNSQKVDMLKAGGIPIYEPGLEELVKKNVRDGRLTFTTDLAGAVRAARLIFIAVGTPQSESGEADLSAVWAVSNAIGDALKDVPAGPPGARVVVVKSTVPVGTNRGVLERLNAKGVGHIDCASNPEFLKEGAAINDFMKPDRVVVGVRRPEVAEVLRELYAPFLRTERPFIVMSPESSEMTKYAANAMLATKISFINEMANLCDRVGADINDVRKGMGHDQRIGFQFLFPGPGYGGSCFPKDTLALVKTAQDNGVPLRIVETVAAVNDQRKRGMARKVIAACGGSVRDKTIAVLGLTFKPNTDDMRDAPSLAIVTALEDAGARVKGFDPEGMEQARPLLPKLELCKDAYACIEGADALVIVTEWNAFRALDLRRVKGLLKSPVVVDLRNIYRAAEMVRLGFTYVSVGRPSSPPEA
jgi:UDPglucose 6-dehydrogenase